MRYKYIGEKVILLKDGKEIKNISPGKEVELISVPGELAQNFVRIEELKEKKTKKIKEEELL